jgi:hypothetical protein
MLSAAAAALLASSLAASMARADTEVSTGTGTALSTSSSGNIIIDATGSVGIKTTAIAPITINSSNSVINNGVLSNANTDSAIGVLIDTTSGSLIPPAAGFTNTGSLDLSGSGTGKSGLVITGGNTYYGTINLTSLTASTVTSIAAITNTASTVASTSTLAVKGDSSVGLYLVQGTTIDGNILVAGTLLQSGSDNSTTAAGVMVNLDGTLNGNFINSGAMTGIGSGMIGVQELGGIHACAAAAGYTCPTFASGAFVNTGTISVGGSQTFNPKGGNLESGSALIIGGSIDGGFLNNGPGTSSNLATASITANGVANTPTVLIDPSTSVTATALVPRGPVIFGPITAAVDAINPGYSFINRGTISAAPVDAQLSSLTMVIQGNSAANYTCFSASVGACTTTVGGITSGGLLNTGTISASSVTNQQTVTNAQVAGGGVITATALSIGAFTTIPRLDVIAETISGSTHTPATINATVNGTGQGSAFAIVIGGAGTSVPVINVSQFASVRASVTTTTLAPTLDISPASAPFTLISEAIVDQTGTLQTINNAGTIQAANSTLSPASGVFPINIQRAIDLQAGTTGGGTINNSGSILGDVLFNAVGNGNMLNVGNTGAGGTANTVTGVANTSSNYAVVAEGILAQNSGAAPLTQTGLIDFGTGTGNVLHVGGFGYVNAVINSTTPGELNVTVDPNGTLFIANTTTSLQAGTFTVGNNGTLGLTISQGNIGATAPVVQATTANISNANLALQFGGFISAVNATVPAPQTITLINTTSGLTDTTLNTTNGQNAQLSQNIPFLFESPASAGLIVATSAYKADNGPTPLAQTANSLTLTLQPRSIGALNADGSPGLALTGDAAAQFPFAVKALGSDSELGAAIASNLTVYNTPGVPSSKINVAASQQAAQRTFAQFAPDVSGGAREVAIMITDQATGPVAARQRLLRSYGDQPGDMTLWGEEFAGHINNKGTVASNGTLTSYKDHGFGFVMGADSGSARNGWYGGAFTFYTGDVSQLLPRATKTDTQWYMLSGYTDWHGKHVFFDTTASVAYGDFRSDRNMTVGTLVRDAIGKRPALMGALGANAGVMLNLGGFHIDPHLSLDGLTLREEGYTEANGGNGFNLQVAPYFANSLRAAPMLDFKTSVSVWGIDLAPEARVGYRVDMLKQPVKIQAAFASTGGLGTVGNTMTFVGPDPDTGSTVVGLGLGASTDTWQLGAKYDWIRGNNASTTQVGTLTLLGRI